MCFRISWINTVPRSVVQSILNRAMIIYERAERRGRKQICTVECVEYETNTCTCSNLEENGGSLTGCWQLEAWPSLERTRALVGEGSQWNRDARGAPRLAVGANPSVASEMSSATLPPIWWDPNFLNPNPKRLRWSGVRSLPLRHFLMKCEGANYVF